MMFASNPQDYPNGSSANRTKFIDTSGRNLAGYLWTATWLGLRMAQDVITNYQSNSR